MSENHTNNARRAVLKSGLALVAAGAAIATTAKAATAPGMQVADDKLAHDLVQYQASPKAGAMCSKCAQFQPPAACAIVASPIAPTGWCVAFAPKEG